MPPSHIPLEIHTQILSFLPSAPASQHLPFLWLTCRATNTLLRAAAERVFVDRHLRHPRTRVRFPLGEGAVESDRGVTVYELEVVLRFVGFEDEDGEMGASGGGGDREEGAGGIWGSRRAVFRDVRPEECFGAGVLEATKARWRDALENWSVGAAPGTVSATIEHAADELGLDGGRNDRKLPVALHPEACGHWAEIRGLALDPELPDLRVDYEKREISFDWRRMLDEYFGEEAYARRRLEELENFVGSEAKRALTDATESLCQTRMPNEEMAPNDGLIGDVLLNPRRDVEELEHQAYLVARRKRIERWHGKRQDRGTRNVHECLVGGEPSPSNVPRASDKVSEMLKLREDLAKDVSICDNANEVRAVYRWNPEHDNIGI